MIKLTWLEPIVILVVALVLAVSLRGMSGNPSSSDLLTTSWRENGPFELSPERGRYALTESVVENKSVNFTPDIARFVLPDVGYRDGKYVSLFAPALSFLVIPGYVIGKYFNLAQVGTFSVISIFALINLYLISKICRKLNINRLASLIAGFVFVLATPAFAYGVNLYQHHLTVLIILLALLMSTEQSIFSTFMIYFLFSLGLALDYPNAFMLLPIMVYSLRRFIVVDQIENRVNISVKFKHLFATLGVVIPLVFFFWFNKVSYGSPFNMLGGSAVKAVTVIDNSGNPVFNAPVKTDITEIKNKYDQEKTGGLSYFKSRNLINGLYIELYGKDRGIFVFTPVILFGLIGAIFLYRKNTSFTALIASVIIMNILLYGLWGDPWGGWAFGSRYLIPTYALLSIFISAFLDRFKKNIPFLLLFAVIGGFSVYINAAGALSTSANPPKVQVLELEKLSGRQEKYSFDRNLDFLKYNNSKSFVYQIWAKDYLSSWQYFEVITGSIIGILVICTIALYLSKEGEK